MCFEDEENPSEQDTLEFELKVKCTWNTDRSADSSDPDEMYKNHKGKNYKLTMKITKIYQRRN